MSSYENLRSLAEASIAESAENACEGWFDAKHMHLYYATALPDGAFVEACTPQAILVLLNDLQAAIEDRDNIRAELSELQANVKE